MPRKAPHHMRLTQRRLGGTKARVTRSLSFLPPCLPTLARTLPAGADWLHEPKLDGWRIQLVKAGDHVALFTRGGHDCAPRLPLLAEAFRTLPIGSFTIDGELVADEDNRIGDVWSVQRALNSGRENQVAVMAFDLLNHDGEDLCGLSLARRKLRLDKLVARAALPSLSFVATHTDGAALLATMEKLGLEGVVSKRAASPYRSGRRPEWVKVKSESWLAANRDRWRAFAGAQSRVPMASRPP